MVLIRRAQKTDISRVRVLMDALNKTRSSQISRQNKPFHARVKKHAPLSSKDLKKYSILLAVEGQDICGYIIGSRHTRPSHRLSGLGYVDEVYVEAAWRRKGIAKQLLRALQKEFRASGCDHMVVKTDEENIAAQHLYTAAGMKRATIELWKKL